MFMGQCFALKCFQYVLMPLIIILRYAQNPCDLQLQCFFSCYSFLRSICENKLTMHLPSPIFLSHSHGKLVNFCERKSLVAKCSLPLTTLRQLKDVTGLYIWEKVKIISKKIYDILLVAFVLSNLYDIWFA